MNVREIAKVTFNLVAIYVIGGLLLAWLYSQTSPVIYKNKKEDEAAARANMRPIHLIVNAPASQHEAIRAALPEGTQAVSDGDVLDAVVDVYKKGKKKLIRKIKKAGGKGVSEHTEFKSVLLGMWHPPTAHKKSPEVYEVFAGDGSPSGYIVESYHKGYAGAPQMFVALDSGLKVLKIEVMSHNETPGLGDVIEEAWFKEQFRNKELGQLEVIKGETEDKIQAITGATISSKAITYGARDAVEALEKYRAGELELEQPQEEGETEGAPSEGGEDKSGH
jgi:RnfABCDGE-type electron transport complex G subunit